MNNTVSINFGMETLWEISSENTLEMKLKEILENFEPHNPFIVIGHSNESYLVCGTSKECNFVIFHPPEDKFSFTSVGNNDLQRFQEPFYSFSMVDRKTEMYGRACISFEDFVKVVKQFLKTGQKPAGIIKWDKD